MPNAQENANRVPFFPSGYSETPTELGGAERHITLMGFHGDEKTHILKEPHERNYIDRLSERFPPTTDSEREAVEELSKYLDSKENFLSSKRDYDKMKQIFGDLLADTYFIIGKPREGNKTGFYVVQKKINGITWTQYSKQTPPEQRELWRTNHRGDLLKLIGGARKALIELGSPVDIWGDNVMLDENENIVLVDPGSPSLLERGFDLLTRLPHDMRRYISNRILDKLAEQERWVAEFNMSAEEIAEMHSRFDFTEEQYQEAVEKVRTKCQQLLEKT